MEIDLTVVLDYEIGRGLRHSCFISGRSPGTLLEKTGSKCFEKYNDCTMSLLSSVDILIPPEGDSLLLNSRWNTTASAISNGTQAVFVIRVVYPWGLYLRGLLMNPPHEKPPRTIKR